MSRIIRYIAYVAVFFFCYAVFLYWVFPYDSLKDRILSAVERQLGGGISVSATSLAPYWFTGVQVEGLTLEGAGTQGAAELLKIKSVRARASFFSLLIGRPKVNFSVAIGKGDVTGSAKVSDEAISLDIEFNNLDLASMPFVEKGSGLKISSKISGEVSLSIDRQQPVRSTGSLVLRLDSLRIAGSEVKAGEMVLALPDLDIAKGRESEIKITLGKGIATVDNFKFANGDLALDVKGKIFLSNKPENYRFNLNGSFAVSQKLGEALPFLFIVDSQKQEDGSYPIAITGRVAKPAIKIGTFALPF
ncbi:MAG: type II secretion system protein GspN [bacterium]